MINKIINFFKKKEFEFEGQRNDLSFTLYRQGVEELRDFLNKR